MTGELIPTLAQRRPAGVSRQFYLAAFATTAIGRLGDVPVDILPVYAQAGQLMTN